MTNKKTKLYARELLNSRSFLAEVGQVITDLGVVGEDSTKRLIYLAGLTACLPVPVSVLVKGPSSSGKSNLLKAVASLFPPERLIRRDSLSPKAIAHGEGSLEGKIFVLTEFRGGRAGAYLFRLQQSEAVTAHEFTVLEGRSRKTEVAGRLGSPVVLTTTTDNKVFMDDETRFLSVWSDTTAAQTAAIVRATAIATVERVPKDVTVWQEATRQLMDNPPDVKLPDWILWIANNLPHSKIRVRRDWPKFLSLLKAVALTRPRTSKTESPKVTFSD
jgi:energy-coupling factor transporter ATP-binding protein EcfA2